MDTFDLIVLGGGPAGYDGAQRAAESGMKVLLIERRALGGTCLNEGCIPTKAFLHNAKMLRAAEDHDAELSLDGVTTRLRQAAIVEQKDRAVKALVGGIEAAMRKLRVTISHGDARILGREDGEYRVACGEAVYGARRLLIATGSEAIAPPIPGLSAEMARGGALTSREILRLQEVPSRLVVVGAGVIGLEMAAYFREAGSEVTVIETLGKVLGAYDAELSQIMQRALEKRGVVFHLSSRVVSAKEGQCRYLQAGKEECAAYTHLLISAGRRPVVPPGLETIGVRLDRGAIVTDAQMRTTAPDVYAAGDVNGKIPLAHVAYREAEVAVNTMLGGDDQMDYSAVAGVVYGQPEAAFIGLSEQSARAAGYDLEICKKSINFSGRHFVENGASDGMLKLLIDRGRGVIVGAGLVASCASEIAYSLALMIQNKIPLASIARTVFPHPTVCEIIREVVLDCTSLERGNGHGKRNFH